MKKGKKYFDKNYNKNKKFTLDKKNKYNFPRTILLLHKKTQNLGYWNNIVIFKKYLFINLLIKANVRNGKLIKSYKILEKLAQIVKKKYKINLYKFMEVIHSNIIPMVGFKNWHLGKIKYKVPFLNLNELKHIKLALSWFNNSIKRNYSKKFKLEYRFITEMLHIFNKSNLSETLKKRKKYHKDLIRNRNTIRFLKFIISKSKKK